jgi:hypothetical protein
MVLYNMGIEMGGLSNQAFLLALGELPLMGAIAFVLEFFVVGNLAKKMAFRLVTPGKDPMLFIVLAISACTVCLMCPSMSFFATLFFKNAGAQFVPVWLQTTALNFPMALCWQIFFAGPAVRAVFRKMFRVQQ